MSNKQLTKRDLITHHFNTKAEFIIKLYDPTKEFQKRSTRNVTSRYTHIWLPTPSADELKAMAFLSSEKNEQSDEAYSIHMNNMEKYLSRTDF